MSDTQLILPEVGNGWLNGLTDRYIIISLKHSTNESTMFWLGSDCGYTSNLINAGRYTREQVEGNLLYYNNGISSVAVPCTEEALATLGLFSVLADYNMLKIFLNKKIAETQE